MVQVDGGTDCSNNVTQTQILGCYPITAKMMSIYNVTNSRKTIELFQLYIYTNIQNYIVLIT